MEEGAVVPLFLCYKFSSILREAEKNDKTPPQMESRFQSIEGRINDICNNDAVSSIPVELLYDVIDALSECRIFALKAAASAKPLFGLTRFFFTKKMMRRLDDIETKFKGSTHHHHPPTSLSPPKSMTKETTHPLSDTSSIIGLKSEAQKIESWLMHSNSLASSSKEADKEAFTAIGIVGIRCGCGKTSLAQKVFSSPRVKSEFSPRIWVCLSNMMVDYGDAEVDPRATVVIDILKELGQEVSSADSSNIVKLLEKVHGGLMGKRYLIVLDDAWEMDEWFGDLGYSLPRGYPMGEFLSHGLAKGSGGAVIVTSRWESVVKRMIGNDDMNVIHWENKFSDDICWTIFCHHSKRQYVDQDHKTNIKKDVITICDGLPLAAKILANTKLGISRDSPAYELLSRPSSYGKH